MQQEKTRKGLFIKSDIWAMDEFSPPTGDL